ncbi:MAG: murein biosynthesis integral membrane protein MurJ [Hyphomicrobiales bacterium]|nr:MAG: murein biosynthesis integral membrane protein MurJ [Hyphomicrobiales bacterium]
MVERTPGKSPAPGGSLYRNFLNVGVLTLGSRILGFVRDALVAAVLGTGPAADAYLAAFRFPNLFRRLFAEGAFNTAFIPLFAKALEQEGRDEARLWAARIMSWLVAVVFVVTVLVEIFMPWVLAPFVPGFLNDPAKYDLTVLLTRICFPYLMCMSLMAAYAAILNGLGHFKAAAFAPILLNIVMIAFMLPLVLSAYDQAGVAIWLAIGTIAGGIAQLALVYAAVRRAGFVPKLQWPRLDADVKRFWVLAVPAVIAGGITQINIFVGTIIASAADSAIAYLYYADRLYQLPLGIIGIAVGTVLLPELSRHLKGGRDKEADASQNQALLISMLLSVPAATALIALATPIVSVLFERGAFSAADTLQTAQTVVWFAAGLPAYVLIRVLQPGFFAREDTRTPTIFAAISLTANVALSLALFPSFAHVGIAIATSFAAWANAVLLAIWLARRGHFTLPAADWRRHGLIILAALLMGGALWGLSLPLAPWLASSAPLLFQILALGALVVTGLGLYFALVHLTGAQPLGQLVRRLRRNG